MRNLTPIRVKSNANYICQECSSTELNQAHHQIPGDDNSLIPLCAECHSQRHPDVPKALFFSINHQPYWHNISAASLAKKAGVHSRTIIRTAKRLGIQNGELSRTDQKLLIAKMPPSQKEQIKRRKDVMPYDSMRKLDRNAMLREYAELHQQLSQKEIGKAFNISQSRVSRILKGSS